MIRVANEFLTPHLAGRSNVLLLLIVLVLIAVVVVSMFILVVGLLLLMLLIVVGLLLMVVVVGLFLMIFIVVIVIIVEVIVRLLMIRLVTLEGMYNIIAFGQDARRSVGLAVGSLIRDSSLRSHLLCITILILSCSWSALSGRRLSCLLIGSRSDHLLFVALADFLGQQLAALPPESAHLALWNISLAFVATNFNQNRAKLFVFRLVKVSEEVAVHHSGVHEVL